jgi:hypothetical protein
MVQTSKNMRYVVDAIASALCIWLLSMEDYGAILGPILLAVYWFYRLVTCGSKEFTETPYPVVRPITHLPTPVVKEKPLPVGIWYKPWTWPTGEYKPQEYKEPLTDPPH